MNQTRLAVTDHQKEAGGMTRVIMEPRNQEGGTNTPGTMGASVGTPQRIEVVVNGRPMDDWQVGQEFTLMPANQADRGHTDQHSTREGRS